VHKDSYENIYCVVSGEKNFILHPPTDLPWIPYQNYPSATYKEYEPGKWIIKPIVNTTSDSKETRNFTSTPWICIDPLNPNYEKFSYTYTSCIFKIVFILEIKTKPEIYF